MKDRLGGWLENGGDRGSKKGAVFDSVAADQERGGREKFISTRYPDRACGCFEIGYIEDTFFFFFRNRDFTRGRDGDLRR